MGLNSLLSTILFLYLLTEISCHAKESCTHFLGEYYSLVSWKKVQVRIECINRHGSWTLNDSAVFTPSVCSNPYSRQAACPKAPITQGWKYHWSVDDRLCHHAKGADLSRFDALALCRVMNGRNMMIVGDSISNEFGISLLNVFASSSNSSCSGTCKDLPTCQVTYNFNCQQRFPDFKLHVIRNDRVSLISHQSLQDDKGNFREFPWIDELSVDKDVSLFILNRGAHFEGTEKVLDDIERTLNYLISTYANATILWRNSYAGHLYDEKEFYGPPWNESQAAQYRNNTTLPYHWSEFHDQNNAIRDLILSNAEFRAKVLYWNIEYLMSYRVDMVDRDGSMHGKHYGLHYCIPGPIDNWPKLMLYILLMIQEMPHYETIEECHESTEHD